MSNAEATWFHIARAEDSPPRKNSILSETLLGNEHLKVIRFAFAAGQELSEHTATKAAMLEQISGECEWTMGGETRQALPGTSAYLPPNLPHSLRAKEDSVVLLLLLHGTEAG